MSIAQKKKYCDYHEKECYIWKNFQGKRYCKEGWARAQETEKEEEMEQDAKEKEDETEGLVRQVQAEKKNSRSGKKVAKNNSKRDNSLLIDILDKQIRTYLLLVENSCFTCDYTPVDKRELQVGHYIKRGIYKTRWALANVHLQCHRCNCELLGNLIEYKRRLGEKDSSILEVSSTQVYKLSQSDLQEKVSYMKELIKTTQHVPIIRKE